MNTPDPDDTYALLVGVETANIDKWTLKGPASDVLRMAEFLIKGPVPKERIKVLLTIDPDGRDTIEKKCEEIGIDHEPASQDNVRKAFNAIMRQKFGTLILFLAGHGVVVDGQQYLLCSDASDSELFNLNVSEALRALRTKFYPTCRNQFVIIDACASQFSSAWCEQDIKAYEFAPNVGVEDDRRAQYWFRAAGVGEAARNDDRAQTGYFSRVFLDLVEEHSGTSPWPFEPEQVRDGIIDKFGELRRQGVVTQHPQVYFKHPDCDEEELQLDGRTDPLPLDCPLAGYRIASTWRPESGAIPVTESAWTRLDIRWCVDRFARQGILVDHPSQDLAAQLNRAEDILAKHALAGLRTRWWYRLDADRVPPPRSAEELRSAVGRRWDTGRDCGLVVTWPAGFEGQPTEYLAGIRKHVPSEVAGHNVPVLFQVHADHTIDAAVKAIEIAKQIGDPEVLVRLVTPDTTASFASAPVPPVDSAIRVRRTALTVKSNRWWTRLEGDITGVDILPADMANAQTAEAVVAQLDAHGSWGDLREEEETLIAIRDFAPVFFPALLRAHAAGRRAPLHYISLQVAARTDRELDIWFSAASSRIDDKPPRQFIGHQATSVALAIMRHSGRIADRSVWLQRSGSDTASSVVEHRDRGGDDAEFLRGSPPKTVTAAWRAGVGHDVVLTEICHSAGSAGCWALFARLGVTEDSSRWLAGLPAPMRAVLGLTAGPMIRDIRLEEDLSDLVEAVRPHLPSS